MLLIVDFYQKIQKLTGIPCELNPNLFNFCYCIVFLVAAAGRSTLEETFLGSEAFTKPISLVILNVPLSSFWAFGVLFSSFEFLLLP